MGFRFVGSQEFGFIKAAPASVHAACLYSRFRTRDTGQGMTVNLKPSDKEFSGITLVIEQAE